MRFRGGLEPFNSRPFLSFWLSNLVSNIAGWMQQTAQPWLILTVSGSAMLLGLDSFAANAPFFLLALPGGVLADRNDRRRLIFGLQALQMACPVIIVAMILAGRVRVWGVIFLSAVVGITDALSVPAFQALIPSLVDEALIPKAIPLNSTQFNLSRLIGPFLAGAAMTSLGIAWCFGINALSYVPFLAAIYLLPMPAVPASVEKEAAPLFSWAAYRSLLRDPRTAFILRVIVINNLLAGPIVTFVPVLVKSVFHAGAREFSLCLMMFGLGGVAAGVVLSTFEASARACYASAAVASGLMVVLALGRSLLAGLVLTLLLGFFFLASNISANTVLQGFAHDAQRGRVASLYTLAARGSLPIGGLLTGLTATMFGVQWALLCNGVLGLVLLLGPTLFSVKLLPRFSPRLFPRESTPATEGRAPN